MGERKKKTSIALDFKLVEWIDSMIKTKRFANRTHALELGIQLMKEKEEEEERTRKT